ncbi:CHAT domain-containing protein [Hymenobacter sp. 15J16-1T3B]|uniref:CHAT domain-containing protein n=1 Tax=Hymenobacter sp. 15J16-1T3B TaxID=2886941 RepID=UPI001D11F05C|nr:CHAT domain-containing protein [Hymenobacter sp. 15J16-1T3B]MCC3159007.1 CHAT domain-containing protein [Hymenobacter sp. 15J16-1T3B]
MSNSPKKNRPTPAPAAKPPRPPRPAQPFEPADAAPSVIGAMDWPELLQHLQQPPTRGGATTPAEAALQDFFGEEELALLRQLAGQSHSRRPEAPRGHVLLLPGLMGSSLDSAAGAPVWINLLHLARHGVDALRLGTADAGGLRAGLLDKRTYTRAVLVLGAEWQVHPVAYDWRQPLEQAADALVPLIESLLGTKQPVHFVAHSMGGLVARHFIHRHPELWGRLRGDGSGGRLVMLGTPNYGSFSIAQALTGTDKLVRWLAKLDLKNALPEVLATLNTFAGTYQLLPAPAQLPAELQALYQVGTWGNFPVLAAHLARAAQSHEALRTDAATADAERMSYVAGCNRRTLSGLEVLAPGEFRYRETLKGDGRVPFELGLLPGVPAYYIDEDHGRLPRNERVLKAVLDLLAHGSTGTLPRQALITRAGGATDRQWHRPIGEDLVGTKLERLARSLSEGNLSAADRLVVEDALARAAAGEDYPTQRLEQPLPDRVPPAAAVRQLRITLTCQSITTVKTPLLVAGYYKGAPPTRRLAQLDQALDHWISKANDHAMLGGELGQITFVPTGQDRLEAQLLLLVGMGEEGRFTHHDLRYLTTNVAYAQATLGFHRFAMTLIGSQAGTMSEERAVLSLLAGIGDALQRLDEQDLSATAPALTLVARSPEQYHKLRALLTAYEQDCPLDNLRLRLVAAEAGDLPPVPPAPAAAAGGPAPAGPRITIERDGEHFRFSAMTNGAVIPVREVDIQPFFPDGLTTRLMDAVTREEQETYGQLMMTTLFPADFQELLDKPLTLILDRETAALPWEMACYTPNHGRKMDYFGPQLQLTRQFRTMLSPKPGISPPLNHSLRVLVVADPAPEPALQLPGARREGRAVVQILSRIKQLWRLDLDVVERIGDAECDPLEILALILNGNFDVVHFAGHGVFNPEAPNRGGWVFGQNLCLSAREIFRARRVPRLVFANACFSATIRPGGPQPAAEDFNRHFAGIAEAFFERGVRNYLGTGWPVSDEQAQRFAQEFYARALVGLSAQKVLALPDAATLPVEPCPLGEAIAEARQQIRRYGSTWGAYQHYGQATDLLLARAGWPDRTG